MNHDLLLELPTLSRLCAISEQVIAAWHTHEPQLVDWPTTERLLDEIIAADPSGPRAPIWERLTRRLQLINAYQWHEEDRSRLCGADDSALGAVKRSIDASNRRRVQTIDALDTHLVEVIARAGVTSDQALLHSETPGSIIDRLTVLALKRYHLAEAAGVPAGTAAAMQARHAMVAEQFEDLAGCLVRLFAEISSGKVRLKLYRQVKIYRDETTGGLRDDLI